MCLIASRSQHALNHNIRKDTWWSTGTHGTQGLSNTSNHLVLFFLFVAFFAFIRLFLYIFVISVRIFIFFSFIHMNVENQRTHNTIITILVLVIVCALAVLSLHQTFFKQQLFTIQIERIILYWSTYFTFEKLFAARWLFTGAIVVVVFI